MLTNNYDNYSTGPFFKATQGHHLFDLVKFGIGSYIFEKKEFSSRSHSQIKS